MLRITPVVGRLGHLFADAGHELHLVGGSVRDALLGVLGHDLDFTTSAHPDEVERLLRQFSRSVWTIGKAFGTIGCRVQAEGVDWVIEVTTYRTDAYETDSRKPEVRFGDSLTEDLVRRDFTVNAMAIDVTVPGGVFVDPHDGLGDLAAGVIRTPGTPEQSFSDDPLRMMRAARFSSQLGLTVAPEVAAAMTAMAERIEIISAERVRDELTKLLLTARPRPGLDLLVRTGLTERVLPELPALQLERDEHHRHKDVYEHSLTVLEQAIELEHRLEHRPDLVNRLAALLHDIGKPATRRFEPGGKVSFHHHDVVGAKLVRKRMKALRFSTDETKAVSHLVELHLRFHGYRDGQWTDSAVRRYVRDAGDELERLHILTRADCTTRNQRKAARLREAYDHLEERIAELAEAEELDSIRPDLDGNQIMELLGLSPGREVGQAYTHMLEYRMEHGPADPETAEAELRRWWAERSG
ncbi:CCA tRNA nucleotidyltransferase [Auraticoccus monumenti]|nr:CCA tRNA nucleotidyltransferase [Auraticoccus monumenti]